MTLNIKGLKLKVEFSLGAYMLLDGSKIIALGDSIGEAIKNIQA